MSLFEYITSHIAVRYVISGGSAAVVNLLAFSFFHYALEIRPLFASIGASLVAFATSFLMQKYFTFREQHGVTLDQAVRYAVVFFLNIVVTTTLFSIFLALLDFALLAQFLAIGLTALASFFSYRFFVFRRVNTVFRAEEHDGSMAL